MTDSLAILLLPCRLEDFALAAHARDLLEIPRVLALEPSRIRTPASLREAASARQARRLRFQGEPRAVVLYHPRQYPLARALLAVHEEAELWYFQPDHESLGEEDLIGLDELARARATRVLVATLAGDPRAENQPLRARLVELEVISHRPYLPTARSARFA
ncbi:MAG: hypothetical protein JO262_09535 [Solirubrobacterales bacterium]|nr:hypothetical protein [Solirubrobacterales bacterium]